MKNSLKQLVAPISIFETLGLKYGGPIDGHDLQAVEKALRDAARIRGPGGRARCHQQGTGIRSRSC